MPDSQADNNALLVELAKRGDTEAFGKLHERYVKTIFRFLYARLDDRMDAEDLTGEVFLRAWRSLSRYRQRG